jgi:hypothetical protein
VLWQYDFSAMNLQRAKKAIISILLMSRFVFLRSCASVVVL